MSLPYLTFKDKGIDFAKQAVTEDTAGNHDKALQLYLTSLEYFKTYLKYEKNKAAQTAITSKVGLKKPWWKPPRRSHPAAAFAQFKEYLERAEYLKGVVGQDSSGPENGAAAAQKVKKPGVGGTGEVSGSQSNGCSVRLELPSMCLLLAC